MVIRESRATSDERVARCYCRSPRSSRRKVVLQAALVIFIAGSALCGTSHNMGELIAFRAVQGLGGGRTC
jgi:MFS family permease